MRSQENALYQRALKFLYKRTNYENFKSIDYDQMAQSLDRLREFLAFLGNPERRYVLVHVAGTKGKGTTCAALDQIYRAAGYRVGLFTSPHLDDVTERFQINGVNCDKGFFAETLIGLVERWKVFTARKKDDSPSADFGEDSQNSERSLTFFEWSLLLALALFARADVDVAILETGMGGRFDATNVCCADVSVLTSISYDHCEQLGYTLREIAGEKLAIVKTNAPLVCGIGFSKTLRHEPLVEENEGEEIETEPDVPSDEEETTTERRTRPEKTEKKEQKKSTEEDWIRQERRLLTIDPQTQITEKDVEELRRLTRERAKSFNAPCYFITEVSPLVASFPTPPFDAVRRWNFEIALKVVDILATRDEFPEGRLNPKSKSGALRLPVSHEAIKTAASGFELQARMEVVSRRPLIVVDGAHNRASVAAAMNALKERYPNGKIKILFASTVGKDVRGMIAEISAIADEIILTERSKDERAISVAELIQTAEDVLDQTCAEDAPVRRKFRVAPDFRAFLTDYLSRPYSPTDVLCAVGSFYFAAEVRREIRSK